MVDTNHTALVDLLVAGYDEIKSLLKRRFGSAELARETTQDPFLRLHTATNVNSMARPRAYLFRVAMNIVPNQRNAERCRRTESEKDAYLGFFDGTPDPAEIVEARSEIEALKRAMMELPAHRRQILLAACMDETRHHTIAQRFSVTVRTIQIELKQSVTHCAFRLGHDVAPRARLRRRRVSS
jgi:RNA polymerase sigma factor (sigma-70 family)